MATRMKAWHVIVRDPKFPLKDIKNIEKFNIVEAKELEAKFKKEADEDYAVKLEAREAEIAALREAGDLSAIGKLEPLRKLAVTRESY